MNISAKFQLYPPYKGLDGGIWNSLISKNLAHYSLSLKVLLIP